MDATTVSAAELQALNLRIVIDTAGPFQERDRRLARLCIDLGIHYIDLADGRDFVNGVTSLDDAARRQGVLIASGASTVPAVSSAVIEYLAAGFAAVEAIEIGIAPGYRGPRGLATIGAILGYTGRPIPRWRRGRMEFTRGWSEGRCHRYPEPVGIRRLSAVDVPDVELIPRRYPGLQSLTVSAGLEVPVVHQMLSALGFLVHVGWVRDLQGKARTLQRLAALFDRFGTDCGAMHVRLRGRDGGGHSRVRTWTVIAQRGDGPQIPATAAVLLTKKLLQLPGYAPLPERGAMPAAGLLTLSEFEREWSGLAIRTVISEADPP